MKPLLAISTWPQSATNGDHDVSRSTWIRQDLMACRFFMGDGTTHASNELLDLAWEGRLAHYRDKPGESWLVDYAPREDEVMLPVPWDFKHMALKTREIVRWALAHGFTHMFKVDTDTYVDVPRLLASEFTLHDYIGFPFACDGWAHASGGAGYWLSQRAMEALRDAAVNIPYEDVWTGQTLRDAGILLHHDHRYRVCYPHDASEGPRPGNENITAHLGFSPEPFDNQEMLAVHRQRHAQ